MARGEPFTLSMLSSFRGNRIAVGGGNPFRVLAGYEGVFGGNEGLKVDDDGTLLVGCRDAGCFVGEVGREGRVAVPVTNGGLDFWGLGEGRIRLFECGYAMFRKVQQGKELYYSQ